MLASSKRHSGTLEQGDPLTGSRRSGSNETFILSVLKSREVQHFKGFTDEDERYLKLVREALEAGLIPKNTTKTLKPALSGNLEPLKLLGVLKRHLHERDVIPVQDAEEEATPRDVILSLYLRRSEWTSVKPKVWSKAS